jgi:outer membrane protein assembly factor BamB
MEPQKKPLTFFLILLLIMITLFQPLDENHARSEYITDEDDWPMFRKVINHTAVNYRSELPTNNSTLWIYPTNSSIRSSPAILNNRVFFANTNGDVICLWSENGTEIWRTKIARVEYSSPAIFKDFLVIGTLGGHIYCLNTNTGAELWNFSAEGDIQASPVIYKNSVYVNSYDGTAYSLNLSTGKLNWNITTSGWIHTTSAIWNDILFFGGCDGFMHAVYTNGSSFWDFNTEDYVISSPVLDLGKIYFGTHNNIIYCLNATSKEIIWTNQTDGPIRSSPAVYGNYVIFADWNKIIYCYNKTTGVQVWKFEAKNKIYSSPAISNVKLVIGSDDGKVYCLNLINGTKIWEYTTGGAVESSPAIYNNKIYIGSSDGNLYCFGETSIIFIPPRVKILSPENNLITLDNKVKVTGNVTRGDLPIKNVEIKLNNNTWLKLKINDTNHWEFTYNLSEQLNGVYKISVRAFDGIQYSSEISLNFTLNYLKPDKNDVSNHNEDGPSSSGKSNNINFIIFIVLLSGFVIIVIIINIILKGKNKPDQ